MELTLDQALQKGIEAHRAGKVQEADRYYTAILKANPKHPDANHNMGVLAVGVGKVNEALPFFKTALEVNPSIAQFWLSYIDALIKLERMDDAKAVLDKAKSNGAKGDNFDQLESILTNVAQIEGDQKNEEILRKAVDLRESGNYDEAIALLLDQLNQSPTNPNIPVILSHCYILNDNLEQATIYLEEAKDINPNIAAVGWNQTRLLLKKKKVTEALAVAEKTNKLFPDDVEGMVVLGMCLRTTGNLDESLKCLNQAIELNPNYAEALINRGLIHLNKKDKSNALTDLEKAFHLKPHIKQIWDLLIGLIVETKNYSQAISILVKMIEVSPDYEKNYSVLALCNQEADDSALAIESFKKILEIRPDDAVMHLNLGIAFNKQNKNSIAIENYKKAISINPDYAEAYINLGNALHKQGKLDEAIGAYNKAISIKPDYLEAWINLGSALKKQGKLGEAIKSYNEALAIEPDFAEAYYNLGIALKEKGELEKAIEAYNKAVSIKPDFAEAVNNMGNALHDQGKLDEAREAYNKATSINPDYAEAYWNLSGTATDISDSKYWVKKCLEADPKHGNAKLTLPALKFYEGDTSEYNDLIKTSLKNHPFMRSLSWAFNLPKLPPLYFHRWALFDHMVDCSKKDRPFYEFGVWRGEAFRYLIKTFKKGYGFDTFEGLPEDWHSHTAGTYSSDGNIPKIEGGEFVVGKFEDTLPDFFAEVRPMASIINLDADLYSSTICALTFAKPVIDQNTILIFDEFIVNNSWEQDEYKALEEFCANNGYTYEVLAISFFTKQVAVKIIGI